MIGKRKTLFIFCKQFFFSLLFYSPRIYIKGRKIRVQSTKKVDAHTKKLWTRRECSAVNVSGKGMITSLLKMNEFSEKLFKNEINGWHLGRFKTSYRVKETSKHHRKRKQNNFSMAYDQIRQRQRNSTRL